MRLIEIRHIPDLLRYYNLTEAPFHLISGAKIYWYAFAEISKEKLIYDSVEYINSRTDHDAKRRVCFLTQSTAGSVFAILCDFIVSNSTPAISNSSKNKAEIVKNTYQKVAVIILGEQTQQDQLFINDMVQLLKQTFNNTQIHLQNMTSQDKEILFISSLTEWLSGGDVKKQVDINYFHQQHLQTIRPLVSKNFNQNSDAYKRIVSQLEILAKHTKIVRNRPDLATINSLEELENLQQQDHVIKVLVYKKPVPIEESLDFLGLNSMLSLLACTNFVKMENEINQWQQTGYADLLKWEKKLAEKKQQLQQSWSVYLSSQAQKTLRTLYQFSSIGFYAEFAGLLSLLGIEELKHGSIANLMSALSQTLQFSKESTIIGTKIMGGLWGLFSITSSGWYGLARLFIMVGGIKFLNYVFESLKVDDKTASIQSWVPGTLGTSRILTLIFALAESYLAPEYPILLTTTGAIAGNIALTELTKSALPELREENTRILSEPEKLLILSMAISGQQIGMYLAQFAYSTYDKLQTRNLFEQKFCEEIDRQIKTDGCVVTYPESLGSFGFWTKNKDPIRLAYTQEQTFFETTCELSKINEEWYALDCEPTQEFEHLRLPQ